MGIKEKESNPEEENLKLLFATADILLPTDADALLENLRVNNSLLLVDDTLIVSKDERPMAHRITDPEERESFEAQNFLSGNYWIYDKKNGLPNYNALYIRQNDEMVIAGVQIWEHKAFEVENELHSGIIKIAHTLILPQSKSTDWKGQVSFSDIAYNDLGLRPKEDAVCLFEIPSDKFIPTEKDPSRTMESVAQQIRLINRRVGLDYTVTSGNLAKKFPNL